MESLSSLVVANPVWSFSESRLRAKQYVIHREEGRKGQTRKILVRSPGDEKRMNCR